MNTRFNYKPITPRDSSQDDIFYKYELVKKIKVLSKQEDGSVDKYTEEESWKKEKCKWSDLIMSYDIGSISDQVISHLEKGTPLITGHTLPAADYTQLEKGAKIKREMTEKGITLDMLVSAVKESLENKDESKSKESEVTENA